MRPANAAIFEVLEKMISSGRVADGVTLREHFERDGALAEIGGARYLADLLDSAAFGPEILRLRPARPRPRAAPRADRDRIGDRPEGDEVRDRRAGRETDRGGREAALRAGRARRRRTGLPDVQLGAGAIDPHRRRSPISAMARSRACRRVSTISTACSAACTSPTSSSSRRVPRWARPRSRPTSPTTPPSIASVRWARTAR